MSRTENYQWRIGGDVTGGIGTRNVDEAVHIDIKGSYSDKTETIALASGEAIRVADAIRATAAAAQTHVEADHE